MSPYLQLAENPVYLSLSPGISRHGNTVEGRMSVKTSQDQLIPEKTNKSSENYWKLQKRPVDTSGDCWRTADTSRTEGWKGQSMRESSGVQFEAGSGLKVERWL